MFSVWATDCDGYKQLANTYDRFSSALVVARDLSKSGFETVVEDLLTGKRFVRFPMKNFGGGKQDD